MQQLKLETRVAFSGFQHRINCIDVSIGLYFAIHANLLLFCVGESFFFTLLHESNNHQFISLTRKSQIYIEIIMSSVFHVDHMT